MKVTEQYTKKINRMQVDAAEFFLFFFAAFHALVELS